MPDLHLPQRLALGGGLEIALHCHYRTVSAHAAGIALPECFLGMLPGWGGAYLLPNLVGADAAVTVIIENALNQNRMLTGPQAHRLGIADAMFEGADFLERSLDWAGPWWPDRSPSSGPRWIAATLGGRGGPGPGDRRREDRRDRSGPLPGAGA